MKRSFFSRIFLLLAAFTAAGFLNPAFAAAHLVTTGMGPVYDGIGHLLLTPEDLAPAVAIALYAGLRGKAAGRYTMFLFPVAWLLGGMFGFRADFVPLFPMASLSFIILGILIAADLHLQPQVFSPVVLIIGLVHGFFNGFALKDGPAGLGLLGIMTVLFVLVSLVSAVVVSLKLPWTRIAVRVLGSWVAAMGILMIGWFVRSGMVISS